MVAWLAALLGEEALVRTAGRASATILGADDERALDRALVDAIAAVVNDTVAPEGRQFAGDALRECVSMVVLQGTPAGSALSELREGIRRSCSALGERSGEAEASQLEQIGFQASTDELSSRLTDEVVTALGQRLPASSHLVGLVALLHGQRLRELIEQQTTPSGDVIELRAVGDQARQVIGWLGVGDDPPRVRIENRSSIPIFDVTPVPALISYDSAGNVDAMLGHSPLQTNRQIDPGSGYVWVLEHCRGWGQCPVVRGQLHFYFKDAAGRSWLNAHDRLSQKENPWD